MNLVKGMTGRMFGQYESKPKRRDVVYIPEYGTWYKLSATSDKVLLYAPAHGDNGLPVMDSKGQVEWDAVEEVNADWFPKLETYFGRDWVPFVKAFNTGFDVRNQKEVRNDEV